MLQHGEQIRRGLDLYGPPSADFTPFPYPPLFPWLMSLLPGDVWSFTGPRLLALTGYLGVAACLASLARRQGVAWLWIAMGLGVWAGGFAYGGGWFDVARADGWALFLHLAGVCCLWGEGGRKRAAAAGLLFLLAGLAKQIGWPLGLLCALAYTWQRKPGVAELWGTLLFGALAAFLLIPSLFGDWAYFYIFEVLAGHPTGWSQEHMARALLPLAPGGLLALWAVIKVCKSGHPGHAQAPMLVALLTGWLAVFGMGAVHAGAYDNVFLPGLLIASLGVMCAGGFLSQAGYAWPRMESWVLGACVVQLGLLTYDPRDWVPTTEYTVACEVLASDLEHGSKPVLAPGHGYLLERHGEASGIHWMAIFDLSASGEGDWGRKIVEELEQRIRDGRYARAVSDRLNGGDGVEMDMGPWLQGFYTEAVPPHRALGFRMTESWDRARPGRSRWDPPSGAPWSPLHVHSGLQSSSR